MKPSRLALAAAATSVAALVVGCGDAPSTSGAVGVTPPRVRPVAEASPTASQPVWSSRPVTVRRSPATQPRLVAVRAAHHATYDRVVFEFSGPLPGYTVRYVPQVVQDGSGRPVPLLGQASLSVVLTPAVAHTAAGAASYDNRRIVTGFPSLNEVAAAGDFEGHVSFGLGLDDVVGFRVLSLTSPSRIVIDVAG